MSEDVGNSEDTGSGTVDAGGLGRDVALRIDQRVKVLAGGQIVQQLQCRDLDDAVTV